MGVVPKGQLGVAIANLRSLGSYLKFDDLPDKNRATAEVLAKNAKKALDKLGQKKLAGQVKVLVRLIQNKRYPEARNLYGNVWSGVMNLREA